MKKNAYFLVLVSLVVGAGITFGLARLGHWNSRYWKSEPCTSVSTNTNVDTCITAQRGWPLTYLHSDTVVIRESDNKLAITTMPWLQVKTATEDWLIWSAVSAAGIGLLVYLLERAGMSTGFVEKRHSTRRR